jgi:hypothetical protein
MFGVFRVKNHDFTPKNPIFSNFKGGGARRVRPLDLPLTCTHYPDSETTSLCSYSLMLCA